MSEPAHCWSSSNTANHSTFFIVSPGFTWFHVVSLFESLEPLQVLSRQLRSNNELLPSDLNRIWQRAEAWQNIQDRPFSTFQNVASLTLSKPFSKTLLQKRLDVVSRRPFLSSTSPSLSIRRAQKATLSWRCGMVWDGVGFPLDRNSIRV